MKALFSFLLFILCLGQIGCSTNDAPTPLPARTVLVYMIANNNLDPFASNNLDSMQIAATAKNLQGGNLIVYYAPRGAKPSLLQLKEENGKVKKYHIREYDYPHSADANVLNQVIQEVVTRYPANSYGLILWSHGTAWLPADYADQLKSFGQEGNQYIEIDELARGIPNQLFDFILFDACYMGNIECAYELREKANYILASPTETMADGWPYARIIPQLFNASLQLEQVCETFYQYYLHHTHPYATVSLIKTQELEQLKEITRTILADYSEPDLFQLNLSKMQRLEYLYQSPGLLYDFSDYIRQLATESAYQQFITCLHQTVIYKAYTEKAYYASAGTFPIESYCGLTTFVPQVAYPKLLDWYKQHISWYQAVYP